MSAVRRAVAACALIPLLATIACGVTQLAPAEPSISNSSSSGLDYSVANSSPDPLADYALKGNLQPVHDPSIIREGDTYYSFSTDIIGQPLANFLAMRCSQDKIHWTLCGSVFPTAMPAWLMAKVPGLIGLWAPDISYFNGQYHLYYAASMLGSQRSVIALATNATLNPTDPNYKWVDRGEVMESRPGDDFNAIDPNILIDTDGSVWMTYGSYWSGIKQREIDPATGMLSTQERKRYNLATRPGVPNNPIEGASLVHHGSYYYLFLSVDYCCNPDITVDNYKEIVGRSTSPHGPFVDEAGTALMQGGGTVLLEGNNTWHAPGGGTVYLDPDSDDSLIVFHALQMQQNGALYLWVKNIVWQKDWPVLQ